MIILLNNLRKIRKSENLMRPRKVRSLAVRHCDGGSCNGCEHELSLLSSPCYDFQRFGLSVVASPRHADVLVVTGSITVAMVDAIRRAYGAMPEPRKVVALGACALGDGVLGQDDRIIGRLDDILPVDMRIEGCPPTPEQILNGLTKLLEQA